MRTHTHNKALSWMKGAKRRKWAKKSRQKDPTWMMKGDFARPGWSLYAPKDSSLLGVHHILFATCALPRKRDSNCTYTKVHCLLISSGPLMSPLPPAAELSLLPPAGKVQICIALQVQICIALQVQFCVNQTQTHADVFSYVMSCQQWTNSKFTGRSFPPDKMHRTCSEVLRPAAKTLRIGGGGGEKLFREFKGLIDGFF